MEQIQVVNKDGYYDCDINISTEEWINILGDSDLTPSNTWKALLGFYNSPNHTANCKELDIGNPNAYKNPISSFGKRVQDKLNRFQVLTTKGKDGDYFIIPMKGFDKKSAFEWTVRPELVKAISIALKFQEKLLPEAIEQYKQKLRNDPTYWEGDPNDKKKFGEKYKWEAIAHFLNHWQDVEASKFAEMFDNATEKTKNLLAAGNSLPRKMILIVAKHKPQEIKEMFQKLYENNDNFNLDDQDSVSRVRECIEGFIQEAKNLTPIIKNLEKPDQENYKLFQDTNAVSTYLWLRYPDFYYKYAYGIYSSVRQKLGLYQFFIIDDGSVDSVLQGFAMYDKIRAMLKNDKELVEMINSRVENLHLEKDFEDDFRTATIDFGYFVSKHFHPNIQQIQENTIMSNNPHQDIVDLLKYKKNVILQGAPGTGKTYSTAAIALGILGVEDVDFSDHETVMDKYDDMVKIKQIFFTTFHQSTDYEDFVEGLKPKIHKDENGDPLGVTYEVEDGIFKKVCKSAVDLLDETGKFNQGNNSNTPLPKIDVTDENLTIYKVSLGNKRIKKEYHKTDSFKKGYIKCYAGENFEPYKQFKEMKKGDIVIVLASKLSFDAIGIVTSEPYKIDDPSDKENERRNVRWIFKGKEYPYSRILKPKYHDREFSTWTAHKINKEYLNLTKLQKLIDIYQNKEDNNDETIEDATRNSSAVLIIDEINRGNVSKIFGELVTLLEADKRIGCAHQITVTLPYSKKKFNVPSNVYIIGTMNTTDRSTGTLDYAVRRRFAFVTLKANPGVIQLDIAQKLFSNIEAFIEKYRPKDMEIDDLMVGHSYFMTEKVDELKLKIKYEVVPLLKEYCNDGLLTCSLDELNKRIKAWENLEVYDDSSVETKDETDDEEDEDQE